MYKTVLLTFAIVLVTGCTSYSGISKADKSGSYYITGNKTHLWISPIVDLCESEKNGDLACKRVNIHYR